MINNTPNSTEKYVVVCRSSVTLVSSDILHYSQPFKTQCYLHVTPTLTTTECIYGFLIILRANCAQLTDRCKGDELRFV